MPDLVPSRPVVKRPSRWRRWFRAAEFAVQLTAAALFVIYTIHFYQLTVGFRSALAEMDRDHPGWRLEDVEKAREIVPDVENSASRVIELNKALPEKWIDEDLATQLEGAPPQAQLNPGQFIRLRQALDGMRPALELGRSIAALPKGRYPITHRAGYFDPLLPTYCGSMRKTVRLLRFDAVADMQAGEVPAAVLCIRAALNTGRSIGDEPGCLPALVRIACVAVTGNAVKRLLSQSAPDEQDLEAIQKMLEAEERHPYWPLAWRGERALQDVTLEAMARGDLVPLDADVLEPPHSWTDSTTAFFFFRDRARYWAPEFLAFYSRLEGTDEMYAPARQPLLDQIGQEVRTKRNVVLLTFPVLAKVSQACTRIQAALRTQATALAAERYRRRHGDWPPSLNQLTPDLLAAVPDDPYTGRPLIYRRLPDGVVIYTVGKDGVDDGGNVDMASVNESGADIGIRLWDAAKRRQPPEAAEPPDLPAPPR